MKAKDDRHEELYALLDNLCEGSLSSQEAARLNELLGDDRAARWQYLCPGVSGQSRSAGPRLPLQADLVVDRGRRHGARVAADGAGILGRAAVSRSGRRARAGPGGRAVVRRPPHRRAGLQVGRPGRGAAGGKAPSAGTTLGAARRAGRSCVRWRRPRRLAGPGHIRRAVGGERVAPRGETDCPGARRGGGLCRQHTPRNDHRPGHRVRRGGGPSESHPGGGLRRPGGGGVARWPLGTAADRSARQERGPAPGRQTGRRDPIDGRSHALCALAAPGAAVDRQRPGPPREPR